LLWITIITNKGKAHARWRQKTKVQLPSNGCWAEEGAVPLNLAHAQGDEGNAQASREHADLRHLEVLREVRDETVVGGGAGDVEGEERPEALVGAASPHELLA
jgi:hypothetical protein